MRAMSDALLSIAAIAAALGPLASRFAVDIVTECASTNTLLLERATKAPAGTVVVAERQTAGRGRQGRQWYAARDASLTFSLLYKLPRAMTAPGGLSLAVGVGITEALRELGVDGLLLKWPNDVLRHGKKLGGILIELAGTAAVIGIGLNLRLPDSLPDDARANAAALDLWLDRNELLARLLAALHETLAVFAQDGFATLRDRWHALNAYVNASVRVISAGAPSGEGICLGVDVDGALLLETAGGIQRILSGDVSLRPI
jgi:BirA family biotin operon repressor/biotin-[acetyl-CoA-carboxylase] ligase